MLSLINPNLNDAGKVHFLELAYSFSKNGHQVHCILPKGNIDKRFLDKFRCCQLPFKVKDIYLFILFLNILQFVWSFFLINKNTNIVYIRFRLLPCSFLKLLLKLRRLKPLILTEHPGWVQREMLIEGHNSLSADFGKLLQIQDAKSADLVLAMTEGTKDMLVNNSLYVNKVNVLQNGTNIDHYYPLDQKVISEFKKNVLQLPDNSIILGFSGNISKWQGLDDLISASANLINEFPLFLLIIGTGKYIDDIIKKINDLNLNDRVIIKKNVPYSDMNIWNNCIDVAFAPKIKSLDGFTSPLKIRDYAACGKPVISTAIRGIKEFEPYGWLITYELDKPNDLENKIRALLNVDNSIEIMGKKGRDFACEYFSWDKVAQSTINICSEFENYE
jgi:glycosyltransferase involved in cell wall biosynthesis